MTFEELAKVVADDYKETMEMCECETFEEFIYCNAWDIKDIKEDVDAILRTYTDAYIDEVDGTEVILNDELMSYRKFSAMFRKLLK